MSLVNLLTGADAGFEGGLGNWVAAANCTVAPAAVVHSGTGSMSLTALAAGNMAAKNTATPLTSVFAVSPGQSFRVSGWFQAAVTARSCQTGVNWYDGAGAFLSSSFGSAFADAAGSWLQIPRLVTAPASAAFGVLTPQVVATAAAGEVHYFDDAEINPLLVFDAILGRVRVDLTVVRAALGADSAGTVQRSADQIRWFTVRGGSQVPVTTTALPVDDYEFTPDAPNYYRVTVGAASYGSVITPALNGQPWLKSVRYPFLNLPVSLADASDLTFTSRSGVFDVIGRSFPVAVTTVRAAAAYTLMVRTDTASARTGLEALLSSGDVVYLQVPATTPDGFTWPVPGGYYLVGDYTESREGMPWERRTFSLPVTAVAAPDPSVTAVTITWQGIVNDFVTWNDLVAAKAAWADVVESVGSPADLIVS